MKQSENRLMYLLAFICFLSITLFGFIGYNLSTTHLLKDWFTVGAFVFAMLLSSTLVAIVMKRKRAQEKKD